MAPTPVFLPGKSHGRRSLVGCGPWGREESGTAEATLQQQQHPHPHLWQQKIFPDTAESSQGNKTTLSLH